MITEEEKLPEEQNSDSSGNTEGNRQAGKHDMGTQAN